MFASLRSARKKRGVPRNRALCHLERLERRELLSASPWGQDEAATPTLEERFEYFSCPDPATGNKLWFATDSASAGTAISTGYKTDDGNIAWSPGDPAGGALTTIAEKLRAENGFAIGVASTVPFTHATPAAFVSHNVSRNNYTQIADEIIYAVEPEVVIGGGHRGWGGNYLSADTQKALEEGNTAYTYVGRSVGVDGGDALAAAAAAVDLNAGDKLFGLFGGRGGNFEYYQVLDTPGFPNISQGGNAENPSLADVVAASLSVLGQDPEGFFVMFEQGDIDWSNHANHYANMIGGIYDLDEAVRTAQSYVDQPGDGITWNNTLMIVTSDHSNSYMRQLQWSGKGDLPDHIAKAGQPVIAGVTQVSYGSTGHTNELVNLYARGKGANLFEGKAGSWYPGTQIVDNTHIYEVMSRAADMGVDHILLFIGDGMNVEHEMAGSRYLYGRDFGLAWHDWGFDPHGWSGFASTWDVTTYNRYAGRVGADLYDPDNFDPRIGYDPAKGGGAPYPVDVYASYLDTFESGRLLDESVLADLATARNLRTPGHGAPHVRTLNLGHGAKRSLAETPGQSAKRMRNDLIDAALSVDESSSWGTLDELL